MTTHGDSEDASHAHSRAAVMFARPEPPAAPTVPSDKVVATTHLEGVGLVRVDDVELQPAPMRARMMTSEPPIDFIVADLLQPRLGLTSPPGAYWTRLLLCELSSKNNRRKMGFIVG